MATKTLFTQIKLRRDNDYNYEAKKNTYIPLKGEVCFVDVAGKGLKAKVGDGVTIWANLPYTDEDIYSAIDKIIQSGYYADGVFYTDSAHTARYEAASDTIYIDVEHSLIYIYNNGAYVSIRDMIPAASATQAGVIKLYSTTGQATDGTMTQHAITTELNKKVEAQINSADELLILSTN